MSDPGLSSSSLTNTAKGIPTIAYKPYEIVSGNDNPMHFIADGDLYEWYEADIRPFEIRHSNGNIWGNIDGDEDMLMDNVIHTFFYKNHTFSFEPRDS